MNDKTVIKSNRTGNVHILSFSKSFWKTNKNNWRAKNKTKQNKKNKKQVEVLDPEKKSKTKINGRPFSKGMIKLKIANDKIKNKIDKMVK